MQETRRPAATSVERTFPIDELFFSSTDPKGRIVSGNDLFVEMSGHSREKLVGAAHNIVRHPEMPRAVFRVLWDGLQAGQPIVAYVRNLVADGSYYWVLALAVPIEGGYQSVRLRPTTAYLDVAKELYVELLELERQVEGGDTKQRKLAIDTSVARLGELLAERGFESYQEYMRAILVAETEARLTAMHGPGGAARARRQSSDALDGELGLRCHTMHRLLDQVTSGLDRYTGVNDTLQEVQARLSSLARDIGMFSLNAQVSSARLGASGATLGGVASLLKRSTDGMVPGFARLRESIDAATALLHPSGELAFAAAVAQLQAEMLARFVGQLQRGAAIDERSALDISGLASSLGSGTRSMGEALAKLDTNLRSLGLDLGSLDRDLRVLRSLEAKGRIESAHLPDATAMQTMFMEVHEQVSGTIAVVSDFREQCDMVVRAGCTAAAQRLVDNVGYLEQHGLRMAANARLAAQQETEPVAEEVDAEPVAEEVAA